MKMIPINKPILAAALLSLVAFWQISAQETTRPRAVPAPTNEARSTANTVQAIDPFRKSGTDDLLFVAKKDQVRTEQNEVETPKQVSILVEYIQVSLAEANRLVRENAGTRDLTKMRKELGNSIEEGSAVLLESGYIMTRSGQRAKTESIEERIYPTEYDPGHVPPTLNISTPTITAEAGIALKTPTQPTAFEMRPVGFTLEVDPVIGADGRSLEINIAPEIVEYVGETQMAPADSPYKELMGVTQPRFYSLKVQTAVSLMDGETILLVSQTPREEKDKRILVLLRADIVK